MMNQIVMALHLKSLTNLKIKGTLEKLDESNKEKSKANELYIEKLIKIVHFFARNNLPVKELYPKMIFEKVFI